MKKLFQQIAVGTAAGALATLPMSIMMLIGKQILPSTKRDPLPPAKVTKEATKAIGLHDELEHDGRLMLTVVSHFGYGATMGALYGMAPLPRSPAAAAATGAIYGLGVWSASYLGWLPAAGLYRSAIDEPADRNTLMIAAHLVWGASLGLISNRLHHAVTSKRSQGASPRSGRRRNRQSVR